MLAGEHETLLHWAVEMRLEEGNGFNLIKYSKAKLRVLLKFNEIFCYESSLEAFWWDKLKIMLGIFVELINNWKHQTFKQLKELGIRKN